MNISYNWLKTIIGIDLPKEELEAYLTNSGLEVEKIADLKAGNGMLTDLIVGEVLEKRRHPNADRLSVTEVSIGSGEVLPIVCGAPNVVKGQKVVVAPVGSILKPQGGGEFRIKEAKIRGEVSRGMICAEDEIGLGDDHDGIMVLEDSVIVGSKLSDVLEMRDDISIEIGLTPNRGDACSHYGVARDLRALLDLPLTFPETTYPKGDFENPISVSVENKEGCPRYSGLFIRGISVSSSPMWLQNALKSIDIKPINNIVDSTNYVLHELGQPIHAFDADKISGKTVIVRDAKENEVIVTLDGLERKLIGDELLICDKQRPLAIAGILGGQDSGINDQTTNVFIESAYFDPSVIRRSAKRHGINTDASFRYERGCDPLITKKAMARVANIICAIAGGKASENDLDEYPVEINAVEVEFNTDWFNSFCGVEISKEQIVKILALLDIVVIREEANDLLLQIPPYRSEVLRNVDVAEEVLRIYGYNEVPMPSGIRIPSNKIHRAISYEWKEIAADHLASMGWNEIQRDSQTKGDYYSEEELEDAVVLLNPLGPDHSVMRKELLYTAMESVAFNKNRKAQSILFYEFGKRYSKSNTAYKEKEMLLLIGSGETQIANWASKSELVNFAFIKGVIDNLFIRLGLNPNLPENRALVEVKQLSKEDRKRFGVKDDVWYAEMDWSKILKRINKVKFVLNEIPKFPEVVRDLAIVLDKEINFSAVEKAAQKALGKFLVRTELFDIYSGEQVEEGKKSYAIRFVLYNSNKTMSDKEIDKLTKKLATTIEGETGGTVRA
jgi:phenylalanyl-tRNA synthetase beta chain